MFSKFSEEARKALIIAKKEMTELKHPYVGSEHLLLAILKNKKGNISKKLNKYGLTYDKFKEEIINTVGLGKNEVEWYLYTPLLKKIIEDAIIDSKENNGEVTVELLFSSLVHEGEGIAIRVMISMGIDLDDIYSSFSTKSYNKGKKKKKNLLIDEYGYDMNKEAKQNGLDPVVGRNDEIDRLLEILCRRTKNNPLLIGEAGVGKTAIVEELSRRIVSNLVPAKLRNKRILSISMSSLVAGTKYRGEFEERITKIIKELEQDGNIIVFIDEMHTLIGAGGAEGAIDASNILKPALARGKLKIIGATTTEEYKKYIEEDKALARRFQTVFIEEPTLDKTKEILRKLRPIYESYHGVKISDDILDSIVDLSNKYIYNRKQPDKAIDILDEVSAKISIEKNKPTTNLVKLKEQLSNVIEEKNLSIIKQDFGNATLLKNQEYKLENKINKIEEKMNPKNNKKEVTLEAVSEIINLKTKIPVYELENNNIRNIQKIEKDLKKKIRGQDEAIESLYTFTKRIKLGYKDENKPTSFLFAGPTGVGKTLLVKEYSNLMFGSTNLITLDMSEFKEEHTISKIIGSPPGYVGYANKTTILEEVRNKPHSVILLDEIEKAHPSVVNLFLQILDEGKIKDSMGNVIRFDNNIIIMTSNIGFTKKGIGFNDNNRELIQTKLKEILSPEIMNRIDETIIFNKLKEEDIRQIVQLKLKEMKNKFKDINISISSRVVNEIIENCKYKDYGARKIEKIIRSKIDDMVIDNIINGEERVNIQTIH